MPPLLMMSVWANLTSKRSCLPLLISINLEPCCARHGRRVAFANLEIDAPLRTVITWLTPILPHLPQKALKIKTTLIRIKKVVLVLTPNAKLTYQNKLLCLVSNLRQKSLLQRSAMVILPIRALVSLLKIFTRKLMKNRKVSQIMLTLAHRCILRF